MTSLAYFGLAPYYALRQIYRRAIQSEMVRVLASNFGLNQLELSLQLVPVMPYINGNRPNRSVPYHHEDMMHSYHPRDRERQDSHSNKYTGPNSEKYIKLHEKRIKPKKLPVWITNRHRGKRGKKGTVSTRLLYFKKPSEILR